MTRTKIGPVAHVRYAGEQRFGGISRGLTLKLMSSVVAAVLFCVGASTAQAAERLNGRTITTTGKGTISAVPDIARITIGATTIAKTAGAALKANSTDMRDIIGVLKRAGIRGRDIQTSNLTIQPRQKHYRDGRPPDITGYQVTNQLAIVVRDLDLLGSVIDKVVRSGANQIHGISFEVSDADKLVDLAREEAIKNARRKASIYAGAAGTGVGRVIAIAEQGASGPVPRGRVIAMARAAPPVERGSKTLTIRVTVTWELE